MKSGAVCVSVDAKETSVSSPAITHAVRGTRVFTGTLPIVIMVFPLSRPRSVLQQRGQGRFVPELKAQGCEAAIGELRPLDSV